MTKQKVSIPGLFKQFTTANGVIDNRPNGQEMLKNAAHAGAWLGLTLQVAITTVPATSRLLNIFPLLNTIITQYGVGYVNSVFPGVGKCPRTGKLPFFRSFQKGQDKRTVYKREEAEG